MTNIAFVSTEYQQHILASICLQEKIAIDMLFLKKGILLHTYMNKYIHKIIYYEDNPFSWRSINKYYQEYMKTIAPYIDNSDEYRIFTWSIINPLSRYAINFTQCNDINLIEDGSGSYARWGFNNYRLGIKTFIISTVILSMINILSKSIVPLKNIHISGWALFSECYPDYDINKKLITHQSFLQVIEKSLNTTLKEINIGRDSVVFITSAYVEYSLLNEEEFLRIMIDAIEKIKSQFHGRLEKIYWKSHPRSNMEDEKFRLHLIKIATGVNFEIINTDFSMELLVVLNREKNLQYYSLGSSSLYVVKAILSKQAKVCLIGNMLLENKVKNQIQLMEFYKSIEIEVI